VAEVTIYITTAHSSRGRQRFAEWVGDPGWLSVPPIGGYWAHCDEWTGETFTRVWWNGPGVGPAHTVEVEVSTDVFDHLVAVHGFLFGETT
jgi:hypothetical protein